MEYVSQREHKLEGASKQAKRYTNKGDVCSRESTGLKCKPKKVLLVHCL